jgi:hypothetical protein
VALDCIVVQKVVDILPVAIDKTVDDVAHEMLMLILTIKS